MSLPEHKSEGMREGVYVYAVVSLSFVSYDEDGWFFLFFLDISLLCMTGLTMCMSLDFIAGCCTIFAFAF